MIASLIKFRQTKDKILNFAPKLSSMQESILILDFGSQVTQLIGRRLRELNVYCEIHPYNKIPELTPDIKGVILSGSPSSVRMLGQRIITSVFIYVKFAHTHFYHS